MTRPVDPRSDQTRTDEPDPRRVYVDIDPASPRRADLIAEPVDDTEWARERRAARVKKES